MPDESPMPKADCYSHGERAAMLWTQDLRAWALRPMLVQLHAQQVTGDHITLASLIAGVAFVPLWLFGFPVWACVALALHVLLDGLDGPLARFAGTASRRGSFTDTTADQVVIALVILALMATDVVTSAAGGAYIFLYTLVVVFAMVRNAMGAPYSWLFRPRFLVYAWIIIDLCWWAGSLEWLLWGANTLLLVKFISGFVRIRLHL